MNKIALAILLYFCLAQVFAVETCSRVAIINYQEVLVDTNSTQKAEGLRFYLEKDQIAKEYLDKYQEGSKIDWKTAIVGTAGTTMVIAGLLNTHAESRKKLLIGGVTLIAVNFFIAKTLEMENESNLHKSIKEYNKRNLPRIYFNPLDKGSYNSTSDDMGRMVYIQQDWNF